MHDGIEDGRRRGPWARGGLALMLAVGLVACGEDDGPADVGAQADGGARADAGSTAQPVVGLIIRRLNPGQDVAAFEQARTAYVDQLTAEPGITTDREFRSVVDFSTSMPPEPGVFIGATRGESLAEFSAAADAVGSGPEAGAFFSTFTPAFFGLLTPLDGDDFDFTRIAPAGSGHVLEVAPRDLSAYADFDPAAYAAARDAFIALLSARPGVVAEYQWVSPADPDVAVGMTVYESQAAWSAIWSDPEFLGSDAFAGFIGAYPPAGGFLSEAVY